MFRKTVLVDKESVQIEWEKNFSRMEIKMNDQVIGTIEGQDAIMQGRSFWLPDRSQITVLYRDSELEVWRNGQELVRGDKAGSVADFQKAGTALQWFGIFQLVVSPIYLFRDTSNTANWWLMGVQILFGGGLVGLSVWAKKGYSKTPIWIGLGLTLLLFAATILNGSPKGFLAILIMGYYLINGLRGAVPERPQETFSDINAPLDSDL